MCQYVSREILLAVSKFQARIPSRLPFKAFLLFYCLFSVTKKKNLVLISSLVLHYNALIIGFFWFSQLRFLIEEKRPPKAFLMWLRRGLEVALLWGTEGIPVLLLIAMFQNIRYVQNIMTMALGFRSSAQAPWCFFF